MLYRKFSLFMFVALAIVATSSPASGGNWNGAGWYLVVTYRFSPNSIMPDMSLIKGGPYTAQEECEAAEKVLFTPDPSRYAECRYLAEAGILNSYN